MIWFLLGAASIGALLVALALLRANRAEPRDTLPSPMLDTSLPELDLTEIAREFDSETSKVRSNPKC